MILLNCKDFRQGASSVRNIFINMCEKQLIKLQKDNSLGLKQLLELYSLEDIEQAFNQIYVNKDRQLVIPEQSISSYILRYLEYGGEGVRPTHLLSTVQNEFSKTFSSRGGNYVF